MNLHMGIHEEPFVGGDQVFWSDASQENDQVKLRLTSFMKVHPWNNYLNLFQVLNKDTLKFSVNRDRSFFHLPVGIGTETFPIDDKHKLFVKGGICTEAIKINLADVAGWGDHVFNEDYQVADLEEVERFIKEHKHLPEIPSAEMLVNNGIDVQDMLRLQMIKLEEMTLHLIEQKKRIDQMEKKEAGLIAELNVAQLPKNDLDIQVMFRIQMLKMEEMNQRMMEQKYRIDQLEEELKECKGVE